MYNRTLGDIFQAVERRVCLETAEYTGMSEKKECADSQEPNSKARHTLLIY